MKDNIQCICDKVPIDKECDGLVDLTNILIFLILGLAKIERIKKNHEKDPTVKQNYQLKRLYGITLDDYNEMLTEQKNSCAICGTTDPGGKHGKFMVDHSHKKNKVRGLLCKSCNIALGEFQDDIDVLQKAVLYLQKNK